MLITDQVKCVSMVQYMNIQCSISDTFYKSSSSCILGLSVNSTTRSMAAEGVFPNQLQTRQVIVEIQSTSSAISTCLMARSRFKRDSGSLHKGTSPSLVNLAKGGRPRSRMTSVSCILQEVSDPFVSLKAVIVGQMTIKLRILEACCWNVGDVSGCKTGMARGIQVYT